MSQAARRLPAPTLMGLLCLAQLQSLGCGLLLGDAFDINLVHDSGTGSGAGGASDVIPPGTGAGAAAAPEAGGDLGPGGSRTGSSDASVDGPAAAGGRGGGVGSLGGTSSGAEAGPTGSGGALVAVGLGGATGNGGTTGNGGATGNGGTTGNGGAAGNGGTTGNGGTMGNGGAAGNGGATGNGGAAGNGGRSDAGPTLHTLTFGERPDAMYQNVTADVDLQGANPTLNFGGSDDIASDGSPQRLGLIRFDVSAIDPSWTILSAKLRLWTLSCESCSLDEPGDVTLFRVLEAWDEGSGDRYGQPGAASWNERKPGVAWSTPGCADAPSRSTTAEATIQPWLLDTEYTAALPAPLIRSWVESPQQNFGLAVRLLPVTNDGVNFWTREYDVPQKRPLLTVDVSIP